MSRAAATDRASPTRLAGMPVAIPTSKSTYGIHLTMSFKRKGPGAFVSGVIGAVVGFAVVSSVVALLALPASAQAIIAAGY
jgi:hypothetical protein